MRSCPKTSRQSQAAMASSPKLADRPSIWVAFVSTCKRIQAKRDSKCLITAP